MAETKQVFVYYEGDDDKAFLQSLHAAKFLPDWWVLSKRDKQDHPGKDGLVRQLLPFVRPVNGAGGSAVVLVDLDDLTYEGRAAWFRKQVEQELHTNAPGVTLEDGPVANERVQSFRLVGAGKSGRVVLVPVGLPNDVELQKTYKINQFAIDDWLLRLILDKNVYSAVSEFKTVPHEVACRKLLEVAELFRKNGLEVNKGKTYIRILRALAAIAPSTATIVERLVKKAAETLGAPAFRQALQPLMDDLDAVAHLLE